MASTINPSSILDGLNASEGAVRAQFTNAASDVNNLQAPTYITVSSSGTLSNYRTLSGTANQITTSDGGATGAFTLSISSNPVLPGTGSVTIPIGTGAQRPGSPVDGMVRYNSDTPGFEARVNGAWVAIVVGTYVSSLNSLTGALSIAVGTAGTDFAVSASGSTVTLNLPDAGSSARGVVTTGTQTIAGAKTFSSDLSVTSTGAVLVSSGTVAQRPGTSSNGMIRYNSDDNVLEGYVNGSWATISTGSGSGVSSLNSLTGALSLATGTSGTDFNISPSGSTITLNIPDASATARGLITTGSQTIAGGKTFTATTTMSGISCPSGNITAGFVLNVDTTCNFLLKGFLVYSQVSTNTFTPTTGQTVSAAAGGYMNYITPAGTLSSLTVQLPNPSSLSAYTVIKVATTKAITTLTVSSGGTAAVLNAPTTLTAGGFMEFMWDPFTGANGSWSRIG